MNSFDEKYQGLKDAKIMIVDDEPINIEVVQAFLEEDEYRNFVTIEDSTKAMKTARRDAPRPAAPRSHDARSVRL